VSPISTHVLDLARGRPAQGVTVRLEHHSTASGWSQVGGSVTDADGRSGDLAASGAPEAGRYRLTFETAAYFQARGERSFHPEVIVVFEVEDGAQKYHVPLLLSPFGYSTYRGS
jgi:5-hydroxyisourate hydrolase